MMRNILLQVVVSLTMFIVHRGTLGASLPMELTCIYSIPKAEIPALGSHYYYRDMRSYLSTLKFACRDVYQDNLATHSADGLLLLQPAKFVSWARQFCDDLKPSQLLENFGTCSIIIYNLIFNALAQEFVDKTGMFIPISPLSEFLIISTLQRMVEANNNNSVSLFFDDSAYWNGVGSALIMVVTNLSSLSALRDSLYVIHHTAEDLVNVSTVSLFVGILEGRMDQRSSNSLLGSSQMSPQYICNYIRATLPLAVPVQCLELQSEGAVQGRSLVDTVDDAQYNEAVNKLTDMLLQEAYKEDINNNSSYYVNQYFHILKPSGFTHMMPDAVLLSMCNLYRNGRIENFGARVGDGVISITRTHLDMFGSFHYMPSKYTPNMRAMQMSDLYTPFGSFIYRTSDDYSNIGSLELGMVEEYILCLEAMRRKMLRALSASLTPPPPAAAAAAVDSNDVATSNSYGVASSSDSSFFGSSTYSNIAPAPAGGGEGSAFPSETHIAWDVCSSSFGPGDILYNSYCKVIPGCANSAAIREVSARGAQQAGRAGAKIRVTNTSASTSTSSSSSSNINSSSSSSSGSVAGESGGSVLHLKTQPIATTASTTENFDGIGDAAYSTRSLAVPIGYYNSGAKIAVVSAVYGGKYEVSCPMFYVQDLHTDFICFTDQVDNDESGGNKDRLNFGWIVDSTPYHLQALQEDIERNETHFVNSLHNNKHPGNVVKYYKMNYHKIPVLQHYEIIIWIDGSVRIHSHSMSRNIKAIFDRKDEEKRKAVAAVAKARSSINNNSGCGIISGQNSTTVASSPSSSSSSSAETAATAAAADTLVIAFEQFTHSTLRKEVELALKDPRYGDSTFWAGHAQPKQDVQAQLEEYLGRGGYDDDKYWRDLYPDRKNPAGVWVTCFYAFDMRDHHVIDQEPWQRQEKNANTHTYSERAMEWSRQNNIDNNINNNNNKKELLSKREQSIAFLDAWYEHTRKYTMLCQMGFSFLAQTMGMKPHTLPDRIIAGNVILNTVYKKQAHGG